MTQGGEADDYNDRNMTTTPEPANTRADNERWEPFVLVTTGRTHSFTVAPGAVSPPHPSPIPHHLQKNLKNQKKGASPTTLEDPWVRCAALLPKRVPRPALAGSGAPVWHSLAAPGKPGQIPTDQYTYQQQKPTQKPTQKGPIQK